MRTQSSDGAALLARLKAGEEPALDELVKTYGPRIYQLAFRHLRNKEDAEEVTQDVLYKVFRNISTFRGDAALSSWIYRITFNAAMTRLRSAASRREHLQTTTADRGQGETTFSGFPEVADPSESADERVFRSQLRRRLLQEIMALPEIYRAPVVLRDLNGLSTEEASAVLHVKDQTLKSRLHRGRLILRQQLAEFAGGLSLRHAYGT